jgi:hypothetical protein
LFYSKKSSRFITKACCPWHHLSAPSDENVTYRTHNPNKLVHGTFVKTVL